MPKMNMGWKLVVNEPDIDAFSVAGRALTCVSSLKVLVSDEDCQAIDGTNIQSSHTFREVKSAKVHLQGRVLRYLVRSAR
jgi:hypothetical protein